MSSSSSPAFIGPFDGDTHPNLEPRRRTLLSNVLVPAEDGTYSRKDILLGGNGKIEKLNTTTTAATTATATPDFSSSNTNDDDNDEIEIIDCTDKTVLPGFVNGHAHSIEHWSRGLIIQLPLELWVIELMRHEPRGPMGWYRINSFEKTSSSISVYLSALHTGTESMLSGCTAIMDHLFVRDINDIGGAVTASKQIGIRAFIAPMLDDDAGMYCNYIPLVPDATERNNNIHNNNGEREGGGGCTCCGDNLGVCGLDDNGNFRERHGRYDTEKTKKALSLWEEAVKKYHKPEEGIEIVIGPATAYSCSTELLRGAAELRKKYNLCGHTHVLETRAQVLQARQFFPSGSAVEHLKESGFLNPELRGTSLAHTVWLSDDERDTLSECNVTCVHNPLSNLRLGSGVMPVIETLKSNVSVSIGCDGSCSSDGQDILEAMKIGTFLSSLTSPEYRNWLIPRQMALTIASKNGYIGIGMKDQAGEIVVGMEADLTLWDLTSLALLPRTDPLSLLVTGSRTQAPGAGSTLHSSWVRGIKTISDGSPVGIDLKTLRKALMKAQPNYRNTNITNPTTDNKRTAAAENEYRAAMGLDICHRHRPRNEQQQQGEGEGESSPPVTSATKHLHRLTKKAWKHHHWEPFIKIVSFTILLFLGSIQLITPF